MTTPADKYRIFVYGVEGKRLLILRSRISTSKYTLEFHAQADTPRFQDADGIIVFQGSFESFQRANNNYTSYWKHQWNRDELDKRTKETLTLLGKGGFVCLLLDDPIIEVDRDQEFYDTDLSKRLLAGFRKEPLGSREPLV